MSKLIQVVKALSRIPVSFGAVLIVCLFLIISSPLMGLGRQETTLIWLEPYRVPVSTWQGVFMADRITFQDGERVDWIWGIEGFDDYQWGKSYVLRVRIIEEKERIPDLPQRRFSLVKVMSVFSPNPDSNFDLPLKDDRYPFLEGSSAGGWSLQGEAPVDLLYSVDSAWLEAALCIYRGLTGHFRNAPNGRVQLLSVEGDFDFDYALRAWAKKYPDDPLEAYMDWGPDEFIAAYIASK